jgi:hypothetical protein
VHTSYDTVGKKTYEIPRRRWEDNIKVDLREICFKDGRWVELGRNFVHWWALVLAVLNLWVLLPGS